MTVIYISHRLDEIFELGDYVTVMRDGAYISTNPIADTTVDEIVRQMDRLGGYAVLETAAEEFKRGNDVFGAERPEWKLMHRVKDALDPKHIFSPGAMPGRV